MTDRKPATSQVATLFGGMAGGIAARKLGLPDLIPILRGETVAPTWLKDLLRLASSACENPNLRPYVLNFVKKNLADRGWDESKVEQMLNKYAPLVGVQPEGEDIDDKLAKALVALDQQTVTEGDLYATNAAVVCPKCKFMHFV